MLKDLLRDYRYLNHRNYSHLACRKGAIHSLDLARSTGQTDIPFSFHFTPWITRAVVQTQGIRSLHFPLLRNGHVVIVQEGTAAFLRDAFYRVVHRSSIFQHIDTKIESWDVETRGRRHLVR